MLRNHITKCDLSKRVNLSDSRIIQFLATNRLFYLAIARDFLLAKGLDEKFNNKIDSFLLDIVTHLLLSEKPILPKEIETFFTTGKIDFDTLSLEIYHKCLNCGKMSSIEAGKIHIIQAFETLDKNINFCISCSTVSERIIPFSGKNGVKTQEASEEILFHGNSVLAAVYETIKFYNLENLYLEHIIKYSEIVINYVFKDDEKAGRYFSKLIEELSEDNIIYELVFLHPNYHYCYPVHHTFNQ